MPIPDLNEQGELPPGEYLTTLQEIEKRFGGPDSRRKQLMMGLNEAIQNLWKAKIKRVVIDGSFTSDASHPRDVDGCWEYEKNIDLKKLDPVFLNWSRQPMKAKYGVDFLMSHWVEGETGSSFEEFFKKNRDGIPKGVLILENRDAHDSK